MKTFFLNLIIAGSLIILIVVSVKEYFIDKTKKPFSDSSKKTTGVTPVITKLLEKPVICNHRFFSVKKGNQQKYTLLSTYVLSGKNSTFTALITTEVKEASGSSIIIESSAPIINWKQTTTLTCTNNGIYGHPIPYFIAKLDGQKPFILILDAKDLLLPTEETILTDRVWESSINLSSVLSNMIPIPLSLPLKNTVELLSSDSADITVPQTLQFSSSLSFADNTLGIFKEIIAPKLNFTFTSKSGIEKVTVKAEIPSIGKIESTLLINK
jgi:hypothetical protein